MNSHRGRAELALAAVTVIWGASFVVVKGALADISPMPFISLRFSLAAVVLSFICRAKVRAKSWKAGGLAGGLLFGAFACQTMGLELTTASKSAFITSLSIPMVPLASSLVYKSRPRLRELAGILIASIGMILMTFPASGLAGTEVSRGDLLSLISAVLFALHIVVIGHFAAVTGFETLAVIQLSVVAILASCVVLVAGPGKFRFTPAMAVAVLLTGLLATALAFTVMTWAQQYTTATRAALIFALEPVVAWFTSYLVGGESMEIRARIGAGLILTGIMLVELKRSNGNEHQTGGSDLQR